MGAQPLNEKGKVVSGNKKVVTDGTFAEGKELVADRLKGAGKLFESGKITQTFAMGYSNVCTPGINFRMLFTCSYSSKKLPY